MATFEYDAEQERVLREARGVRTFYVNGFYEKHVTYASTTPPPPGTPAELHRYYVRVGARVVAQIERTPEGNEKRQFLHADHLGSTSAVSDLSGNAVPGPDGRPFERSFDVWGKERRPDRSEPGAPVASPTPIGFTGHEDDVLGLVNMGGRIYDPLTARFLSPDPIVQAPHDPRLLNRYAYVRNSPTNLVDPTGHIAQLPEQTVLVLDTTDDARERNTRTAQPPMIPPGPPARYSTGNWKFLPAEEVEERNQNTFFHKHDRLADGLNGTGHFLVGAAESAIPGLSYVREAVDTDGVIDENPVGYTAGDVVVTVATGVGGVVKKGFKRGLQKLGEEAGDRLKKKGSAALGVMPDEGATIVLKKPAGVSDAAWDKKVRALNDAAKRGDARVVHNPARSGVAQRQARREGRIQPGHDADHELDLQFNGEDVPANITSTPSRINRSVGGQGAQRMQFPDGTPIKEFKVMGG